MVKLHWLAVLFAFTQTVAAATLSVHVDRTEVVLGTAVLLELVSASLDEQRPLDALTLNALAADFEVVDVSRGTRAKNGVTTQSLTAALYPRRAGHLQITAFTVSGAQTAPIDITVRESGPHWQQVLFRVGIEPQAPYMRTGALLYFDIYDNNGVTWSAPVPVAAADTHLRALAETRRTETVGGESYNVLRHAWAATALRDGAINIAFESLRARRFGQRLRYSVPPFRYTAHPVPAYLPVYVPIGAPAIEQEPLPTQWVVGRPVNWQFTLTGVGLNKNGITQLLETTWRDGQGVTRYPPTVEIIETDSPRTARQTFRVTIPVQATQHGTMELPHISLPYFDPQSEQIQTLSLATPHILAIDPARVMAIRVGIVLLCVLLIAGLTPSVYSRVRRHRERLALIAQVEQAQSARELKTALLGFAAARNGQTCHTLQHWIQRSPAPEITPLENWIARLERSCYAAQADDFATLKADALNLRRYF